MFNRSRKKIILSIMGSLILLFSVTLSVILAASFREVRHRNSKMLEHYVQTWLAKADRAIPALQSRIASMKDSTGALKADADTTKLKQYLLLY